MSMMTTSTRASECVYIKRTRGVGGTLEKTMVRIKPLIAVCLFGKRIQMKRRRVKRSVSSRKSIELFERVVKPPSTVFNGLSKKKNKIDLYQL